uniref:Small ribosomal subunit protein uS14 n=1 Tax=Eptatretus burgeri TaxID=7764 RepID=A0A8C4QQY5_EPTBU
MGHQQVYQMHPRKFGSGSRGCRVCANRHGLIRKYGLNMCRQCFRQYAKDIGFQKVSITRPGNGVERFFSGSWCKLLLHGCGLWETF